MMNAPNLYNKLKKKYRKNKSPKESPKQQNCKMLQVRFD